MSQEKSTIKKVECPAKNFSSCMLCKNMILIGLCPAGLTLYKIDTAMDLMLGISFIKRCPHIPVNIPSHEAKAKIQKLRDEAKRGK